MLTTYAVPGAEGAETVGRARAAVHHLLALAQEWLADERFAAARLVVVTRGAVAAAAGESVRDLVHAPLWGLLRSAQTENPDRFVLADLDDRLPARAGPGTVRRGAPTGLEEGRLLVPRLTRATSGRLLEPPAAEGGWRLDTTAKGTLENLALLPYPQADAPLPPGHVRLAVRAAGMNFRDVLLGLGMVDQDVMGGEAAGVVLEVAPTSPASPGRPGDGHGAGLVRAGRGRGPAAARPAARALDLHPGRHRADRLPHRLLRAGGPGRPRQRRVGADPRGHRRGRTGGDPARPAPGRRGVHHREPRQVGHPAVAGAAEERIASSRSLEFEERVRGASGGRGVDVVLNSLAKEFVDASLRLLPPGGRFVEMGKTDIRDAGEVAAAPGCPTSGST
ncbi:zinc-binding dehydrogenase [Streptacidiphilus sp. 4-A2]|nr:zinc-binding dehydrogenase [Streptacidiphilus sp. 4-A2]